MKPSTARKSPVRKTAAKAVKPIPEGYHTVTPYLAIRGAAKALEFYKKAFGARERMRLAGPGGDIGHAEIVIGDSVVMLADEFQGMDFLGPLARGGTPVTLHLYVRDCDAAMAKAAPPRNSRRWYEKGMKPFDEAIAFAQSHEIPWPRDPAAEPARWGVHHPDPPPFNRLRGPVHPRGGVSGVIRLRGEEVAAWGEPDRADQTFSVAKTYLAVLAGLAQARGLLDVNGRVGERLPGIGFDSEHNRAITWEHLLTQTSEWEGECFGMPDWVEHNRRVSHDPKPPQGKKGERRELRRPGTYWEYNDVRINQLSLALLHLFKRPLPEVFLESVLRPIGGGRDFKWEGYEDSWVEVESGPGLRRGDQARIQSVPGGTHWGGGVSISARDQARIGQLLLDGGVHEGQQIVPADWVHRMRQPCAIAPFYGWLTWLNADGRMFPEASRASWFMFGAGGHVVWIDPGNDMVAVARWLDSAHTGGFVRRVMEALKT